MNLFAKFATVGGATMLSRVLGFVREVLIANVLGTGPVADAFYAAFRFPNLFRRLFAEGAFNSAFVPLFAKELEGGGEQAARTFAEQVLSVLVVALLFLTALAEIFMPWLVATVVAPGFEWGSDKYELTVLLTRIVFPYLMCMSVAAMLSGVLNSFRRYAAAALAPVALNLIMISVLLACRLFDTGNTPLTGRIMAAGVMTAGVVQMLLLYLAVRHLGFRLGFARPRLTPAVRRLMVLAVPAAIAGGITQINLMIGQMIASQQSGAISVLQFADRIYQLPLGVVGIAVGVVLLPELARHLKAGEWKEALDTENRSMLFAAFLTLPAAAALAVIAGPVIRVLFEHGAFGPDDTAKTAAALRAFAFGLPAFVLVKIFSPGYFAREDTKTPMWFAGLSVAVNITGSLALFPLYGYLGIAVATSVAGWINAIALYWGLHRRGHWGWRQGTARRVALMLVASLVMAGALVLLQVLTGAWLTGSFLFEAIGLGLLVAAGGIVYFALVHLLGGFDLRSAGRFLRRT